MYKDTDSETNFILIAFLIILVIILFTVKGCVSSNIYNNGICTHCGGNLVFKEAVGHRYSTNYIYICDKCGRLIESSVYFRGR